MSTNDEEVADYADDGLYEEYNEADDLNSSGDGQPEEMKKRMQEMEEELDRLNKMQQQVERQISTAADSIDEKSIYVGQVDYEATPEELRAHFAPCGTINRVTIMCDKATGHSKGFAYVEFVDKESVENALKLDESTFKSRNLKVLPKRQNVPMSAGRSRGRGRGPPSRGGRHFSRGRSGFRGRGGPVRGRGRSSYYPNSYY